MLVAVVVPNEDNTKKWANQNGHQGSLSQLCSLVSLRTYVLSELKSVGERNKVFIIIIIVIMQMPAT